MTIFEGRCLSGDGILVSRDRRVIVVFENMEAHESIVQELRKGGGISSPTEVHLHECMQHGQQTGETIVQQERYDKSKV